VQLTNNFFFFFEKKKKRKKKRKRKKKKEEEEDNVNVLELYCLVAKCIHCFPQEDLFVLIASKLFQLLQTIFHLPLFCRRWSKK
jgi:hypothetical protein